MSASEPPDRQRRGLLQPGSRILPRGNPPRRYAGDRRGLRRRRGAAASVVTVESGALFIVRGLEEQLVRVVRNLIDNARSYSSRRGACGFRLRVARMRSCFGWTTTDPVSRPARRRRSSTASTPTARKPAAMPTGIPAGSFDFARHRQAPRRKHRGIQPPQRRRRDSGRAARTPPAGGGRLMRVHASCVAFEGMGVLLRGGPAPASRSCASGGRGGGAAGRRRSGRARHARRPCLGKPPAPGGRQAGSARRRDRPAAPRWTARRLVLLADLAAPERLPEPDFESILGRR